MVISLAGFNTEKFIDAVEKKHPDNFTFDETNYRGRYDVVYVNCKYHGRIEVVPRHSLKYKHVCKHCSKDNWSREIYDRLIKLAVIVHGNKYDYSKVEFSKTDVKVEIICPRHGSFYQSLSDHANKGHSCKACAIDKDRIGLTEFLNRANSKHGNTYDYSKVRMNSVNDRITVICKTHGEWEQRAGSHLAGNGCRECYYEKRHLKDIEEFFKKAKLKHGNAYDYSKVIYGKNNRVKVEIICPRHGSFYQTPFSHLMGNGCVKCRESTGERQVCIVLDELGLSYIREYNVKPYYYDFYIPEYKTFIEFHGKQHYLPIKYWGGDVNLKDIQRRDKAKVKLAKEMGYSLIVVNYKHLLKARLGHVLKKRLYNVMKDIKP